MRKNFNILKSIVTYVSHHSSAQPILLLLFIFLFIRMVEIAQINKGFLITCDRHKQLNQTPELKIFRPENPSSSPLPALVAPFRQVNLKPKIDRSLQ